MKQLLLHSYAFGKVRPFTHLAWKRKFEKMWSGISPEKAMKFTKMTVICSANWPLPITATKFEMILFEIFWWISIVHAGLVTLPMYYGIYVFRHDLLILTRVSSTSTGMSQVLFKMIVCKIHRKRFQTLISDLETFLKMAKPHEREVLQRYINKCAPLHFCATIVFYSITVVIVLGPAILPQTFPMPAEYPFDINKHPWSDFVYITQSIGVWQASMNCTIDCFMGFFIWYITARFEMLGNELENVTDNKRLCQCIQKHNFLLKHAEEVRRAVRFSAFTSLTITVIAVICSGIQMLFPQPSMIKIQYGTVVVCCSIELFLYAWPANNLIEMTESIAWRAYRAQWIGKSPEMTKNLLFMIARSSKPLVIDVGAVIPALSLNYYAKFLSTAFSYFTTIRLIIDKHTEAQ